MVYFKALLDCFGIGFNVLVQGVVGNELDIIGVPHLVFIPFPPVSGVGVVGGLQKIGGNLLVFPWPPAYSGRSQRWSVPQEIAGPVLPGKDWPVRVLMQRHPATVAGGLGGSGVSLSLLLRRDR